MCNTETAIDHAAEIAANWTRPGPAGVVSDGELLRAVFADDAQLTRALNGDAKAHQSYAAVAREFGVTRVNIWQRIAGIKLRLRHHLEQALPHPAEDGYDSGVGVRNQPTKRKGGETAQKMENLNPRR